MNAQSRQETSAAELAARVQAAEARYLALFASVPDPILLADAAGRLIDANPAALTLLGYDRDNLLGRPVADLIVGDPDWIAREVPRFHEGGPWTGAITLRRSDGSAVCIEAHATRTTLPDGPLLVAVLRDVTQRHQADEALRLNEARKSAMLESALDCIITIDDDGRILEFNPAAEQTFGYQTAEVLGRRIDELLIPPSLRAQHRAGLARYLATGEGPVLGRRVELTAMRADGATFPVELSISRLPSDGPPVFTGFVRDLSDRRQAEQAASQAAAIAETNRLQTELLNTVSHELRTPLAAIKGFTTTMLTFPDRLTREEQFSFLQEIDGAADRLGELVENLLQLARLESGALRIERAPVSLVSLLLAVADEARRRHPDRVITLDLPADLPLITADGRRIGQVAANLVENAIKFSPDGGEVDICAGLWDGGVEFSVTDHGIGIAPHHQERIFERFYRVDNGPAREIGGTGLGLAICRRIVAEHDGAISVVSREGEGSTFTVRLPAG